MLTPEFFARHPLLCAAELIGCELIWENCSGIIVETEAYAGVGDASCQAFLRRGGQKFADSHPPGTAYIYRNYGVHKLLNVLIKGPEMVGFVLIRALAPRRGVALMEQRRRVSGNLVALCSGPGKLTEALAIPAEFHGRSLCAASRHSFHARPAGDTPKLVADVRIGITHAAELPWRFLAVGSRFVSRRPSPAAVQRLVD